MSRGRCGGSRRALLQPPRRQCVDGNGRRPASLDDNMDDDNTMTDELAAATAPSTTPDVTTKIGNYGTPAPGD